MLLLLSLLLILILILFLFLIITIAIIFNPRWIYSRGSLKIKIIHNWVIIPWSQGLARRHETKQRCSVAPAPRLSETEKLLPLLQHLPRGRTQWCRILPVGTGYVTVMSQHNDLPLCRWTSVRPSFQLCGTNRLALLPRGFRLRQSFEQHASQNCYFLAVGSKDPES